MNPNAPLTVTEGQRALTLYLPANASDLTRAILQSGRLQQSEVLGHLRQLVTPGQLLVDVGAGFGNHALFAAGVCGMRVLCFEPDADAFATLGQNLALNGLEHLVTAQRIALGRDTAAARVTSDTAGAQVRLSPGGTVAVSPLDAINLEGPPAVIRIDVDGAELDVLRGAEATIRKYGPQLYIDTSGVANAVAVVQLLGEWGYEAQHQLGSTPTLYFAKRANAALTLNPLSPPGLAAHGETGSWSDRGEPPRTVNGGAQDLSRVAASLGQVEHFLRDLASQVDGFRSRLERLEGRGDGSLPAFAGHGSYEPSPGATYAAQLSRLENAVMSQQRLVAEAMASIPQLTGFVTEQTTATRRLESQVMSLRLTQGDTAAPKADRPIGPQSGGSPKKPPPPAARSHKSSKSSGRQLKSKMKPASRIRKMRKLLKDPERFLADSNKGLLKALGKVVFR